MSIRTTSLWVLLAASSSIPFVAPARAENIDLNAILLQRLKSTAANTRPGGYTLQSLSIKGTVTTDGIRFTLPNMIPENALVIQQNRIRNCNDREVKQKADVNKATVSSETLGTEAMLGGATTVTASYKSPLGFGGSVSQTFSYSNTKLEQTTVSETVTWMSGAEVPVGPKAAVDWQFVVAEQKLERVPWSTNVIVSGPVELVYAKPVSPVTLCVFHDDRYRGPKKCWTTTTPIQVNNFKAVTWEGIPAVITMNDRITSLTLQGQASVEFWVQSEFRGTPTTYTGSNPNIGRTLNDEFSSMKLIPASPTETRTENLDGLLAQAQRSVALNGTYRGTNGILGEFRIGAPTPLAAGECAAGTPVGANAVAASAGQVTVTPVPVSASTQRLQGRVLSNSIKPAARRR